MLNRSHRPSSTHSELLSLVCVISVLYRFQGSVPNSRESACISYQTSAALSTVFFVFFDFFSFFCESRTVLRHSTPIIPDYARTIRLISFAIVRLFLQYAFLPPDFPVLQNRFHLYIRACGRSPSAFRPRVNHFRHPAIQPCQSPSAMLQYPHP